jgi:hypothetical protein
MKKLPLNRVGGRLLSPAELSTAHQSVQYVLETASQLGPSLSPTDRKRLSKHRIGAEPMMELIIRLAKAHQLASRHVSPEDIQNDLALIRQLEPVVQEMVVACEAIKDVLRQARSEAWDGALVYYSILGAMAESDAILNNALKPFVEFMSTKAVVKEEPIVTPEPTEGEF